MADNVELPQPSPNPKPRPKRFVKNQIPDSITADPALNAAISLLPSNYNFEVHKCVWRILSSGAKRVALQFPEGLLMYSLVLSDIFKTFAKVDECLILGDVTYGACCVDDFSASALEAELLIHYGHSCLIPIDYTKIPSLYVFVEIKIDVDRLVDTIRLNVDAMGTKKLALAGTIQFSAAIRAAKPALESAGFGVLIPQAKPLSAGEVLGCTSPTIPRGSVDVVVFVADGRFHLEAFMIANPGIKAFRYDPYLGVLFLEEYDHKGMKEARKNAIMRAREAKSWGIVLGTLGRQGNPRILDRLQNRMREKGFSWTVVLMSEISPPRIALFGDSVDAWIQIACPRLSIDWGDAFEKPLLTPFEAEIALGFIPGWWEKPPVKSKVIVNCKPCESIESCCQYKNGEVRTDGIADYPMDYYAQDGGEWNCSYSRKSSHPLRRNTRSCTGIGDVNSISVGSGTNIQDNSLVHVAKSNISGKVLPTIIGDSVTVGHSAVLHGCTVEDEAFVGMGATLLDGVVVEKHAMVAAGALVRQNTKIPCGEVWGGNPAKFLRKLTDEEIAFISQSATNYTNLAQVHAADNAKTFDEIELEKALRKKFSRRDEEYDSMLGVVRETPPQLILPDNILPDKSEKSSSK